MNRHDMKVKGPKESRLILTRENVSPQTTVINISRSWAIFLFLLN